ncbi:MAG: 50S ribosomal protein L23 [Chloroflexi bacterium RBG_13_54_8]|nr:MAG: 50S ribosomal protein L23 [Chloroflexi bacterium RBG_13_54_8]
MDIDRVLRRPVITEKSTSLQERGKYTFEVMKRVNKRQVKEAVEKAFKVKVLDINLITVPGKTRRVGRRQVKTASWRKALVKLEAGQKIEFFEGV